ncbi:MAG: FAD-binding oxidoreductase [Myxococcales bacterium]|nr:FAD-binding oxidoreductase [Myxococcales bacterium]
MAEAEQLLADLRGTLPESRFEVEPATVAGTLAGEDQWSVTIQPRSERDVAKTFAVAAKHGIPVRIGGRSPQGRAARWPGGVVRIDMTSLHDVLTLDQKSHLIQVRVGISVSILKAILGDARLTTGWEMRVDEPHTLGAVLAGVVAVRCGPLYGTPAESIRALTVILPSGEVFRSKVAPRSATGPGLTSIFLNTHGRLGVLIEAAVRVFPQPENTHCYVCRVPAATFANLASWLAVGPLPHLVEAHVLPDGQAEVLVSLHGSEKTILLGKSAAEHALGTTLQDFTGIGSVPNIPTHRSVLKWSDVGAFVDAWQADPNRTYFQFANASTHSVHVFGGGPAVHEIIRNRMNALAITNDPIDALLRDLKRTLDPQNLLGDVPIGRHNNA